MLASFPLFLISFAIYNMIAFITPGTAWESPMFSVPMQSGATWAVSAGDLLLALSLLFLFFEMLKATRSYRRTLVDHMLSTLVFVAALIEFLLVKEAATSVFALLLLMSLVDVIGGWAVSLGSARRDIQVDPIPPAV
ncbi:MAG TPA: hypothetical protein VNR41_02410 [Xanthobacteraceae bacterium]|jgi:hypothetical protein|nr:hypothetical protein [Xanthobacteraceae bacterium]